MLVSRWIVVKGSRQITSSIICLGISIHKLNYSIVVNLCNVRPCLVPGKSGPSKGMVVRHRWTFTLKERERTPLNRGLIAKGVCQKCLNSANNGTHLFCQYVQNKRCQSRSLYSQDSWVFFRTDRNTLEAEICLPPESVFLLEGPQGERSNLLE